MESVLYAEVYLICIIVAGLLFFWMISSETNSTSERWLKRALFGFLVNFGSNFFFTLFNGIRIVEAWLYPASYLFKTLYHLSLCVAVFGWIGYAEAEHRSALLEERRGRNLLLALACLPVVVVLMNLWTRWLFYIDNEGAYRRSHMFQAEMAYLLICTTIASVRLLRRARFEFDPAKRWHMRLTASFPLCLLAAWVLSFVGESVPVICVSIMLELLCLYMGTLRQQVSTDRLTQVNNRQNLLGFMNCKLRNHELELYLLMLDVDRFKSINDTYGHLEGDAALIRVAGALKQACGSFRRRPYIARYGGDEFIVVLEGTREEAQELCQGIDQALEETSRDADYQLRVSIGIAQWQEGMSQKELIALADQELYQMKRGKSGRKRNPTR